MDTATTPKTPHNRIYSVSFHVKPGRKVHTFWFTDRAKAVAFLESVKKYPKTLDYSMYEMAADVAAEYDGKVEEGRTIRVETD